MRAEVISIGDELTSGQRLDTNSRWLSQQLADLGIRTLFHTTVADDLESNRQAFDTACGRTEIVVATGGLGPTADDLTRQAIALTMGVELVQDDASLDHIRRRFANRARPMPESNRIQAMFPAGTSPIPNPHGTAPGIHGKHRNATFFCLPGVPAEMKEMWSETVQPCLIRMLGDTRKVITHRRLKCFGVGESDLEQMLPDLIRRGREPSVGITVSRATITLRITAEAQSVEQCRQTIAPTEQTIRDCLGEIIFGEEDDELHDVVHRQLAQRSQRLGIIECGTHGLLAGWFAPFEKETVPIAVVAPTNTGPQSFGLAATGPLHSEEIVGQLAQAARTTLGTDLVAVVGHLTHPLGAPEGSCPCAIADAHGCETFLAGLVGHPEVVRPRIAKQLLNRIRLRLLD